MFKIDEYDRKFLYELNKDGRASLTEISKQINKSKSFILYRIEKMKENGFYLHDIVIYDGSRLGYQTYYLYLRVVDRTNKKEQILIDYLKSKEEVYSIQRIIGKYQFYISIFAENVQLLESLLLELVQNFPNLIVGYRILLLYAANSSPHNYLFKDYPWIDRNTSIFGSDSIPVLPKEKEFLKVLSQYPRGSFSKIAEKMGSTLITVREMYKDLVKRKIIISIRPSLEPRVIGFLDKHITIKMKFRGLLKLKDIKNYLFGLRETKFLSYTFGNYDLTGAFVFADLEGFKNFQMELFNNFGEYINFIDFHDYFEEIKYKHFNSE